MLTGQAKTDYQREYMRRRRGLTKPDNPVRPKPESLDLTEDPVRPEPVDLKTCSDSRLEQAHTQSYNPMMVGYVPPKDGQCK